ncbi:haloacid dehalogenase/epoxide hydrolase family [Geminocystis sp. NIES-3708]|uniref:HAD family hydrolase n=1 Tax=Geminocystis sp. NIES-3708 TaxID=1615909 RepID=UPI0005FC66E8|nr:HAD family hydrolase [Geminocystis sp. NIES-3708]BAQ59605.1 haloacid dehalogenase/epoxide hydrolase family [Geminocystis sp. NIES-3708]
MRTIICQKKSFENVEAIIFDKDGTLADSESFLRELAFKRARLIDAQIPGIYEPLLMAFGVENDYLNPTGLMAVGSNRENQIVSAGYIAETGRSWFESLAIAEQCFINAEKSFPSRGKTSPLFAGSLEVLQTLKQAGLKIAILSADTTAGVQEFVINHQLNPYIDLIMGVDSGLSKPDPRLYLQACEKLGVKPENSLMIGDSQGDISMAKNAQAGGVIGICWKYSSAPHLEVADVVISDLAQIKL